MAFERHGHGVRTPSGHLKTKDDLVVLVFRGRTPAPFFAGFHCKLNAKMFLGMHAFQTCS